MNKFKITKKNSNKGFTLIELMLVVILVSILSGIVISVVNVTALRAKSRDSQRKSDISKIRTALELYYTDNRSYPVSTSWINTVTAGNALVTALVPASGTRYIDVLPTDPSYIVSVASPCSLDGGGSADTDYRYNYRSSTGGSFYILTAIMEVATSNDDSTCSSLSNWTSTSCGGALCGCAVGYTSTDFCYGVQNPF